MGEYLVLWKYFSVRQYREQMITFVGGFAHREIL
jgi:hypothetical protein